MAESAEHLYYVDLVDELRGELPLRDVERRVTELAVDLCQIRLILLHARSEPDAAAQHFAQLDCAEVRCHEDHASRQIHFAVVIESVCGLIKNYQQELPQRVVRFLDFIEE